MKCKRCKKSYHVLDEKTELCAFCFKEEYKTWSKTFTDEGKKTK